MADKKDLFNSVFQELSEIQLSPEYFFEEAENIDEANRKYEREETALRKHADKLSKNIAKELKRAHLSIDDYIQNRKAYFAENIFHKAKYGEGFTEEQFYQNKLDEITFSHHSLFELPEDEDLQNEIISYRQYSFEKSNSNDKITFDNLNEEFKNLQNALAFPVIQNNKKLENLIIDSILLNINKFNLVFDYKDKPYLPKLVNYNETAVYKAKEDVKPILLQAVKSLSSQMRLETKPFDFDKMSLARDKYIKYINTLRIDVSDDELQNALHSPELPQLSPALQLKNLLDSAIHLDKVPWEHDHPNAVSPFNYETGSLFQGHNLIAASLHMAVTNSTDPRYLSEDKIRDAGLSLNDTALPLNITYKSVKNGAYVSNSISFFNAAHIKGIPPLQLTQNPNALSQPVTPERANNTDDQISNNITAYVSSLSSNREFHPAASTVKYDDYVKLYAMPANDLFSKINQACSKATDLAQNPKAPDQTPLHENGLKIRRFSDMFALCDGKPPPNYKPKPGDIFIGDAVAWYKSFDEAEKARSLVDSLYGYARDDVDRLQEAARHENGLKIRCLGEM
jgi:hypothetical protein